MKRRLGLSLLIAFIVALIGAPAAFAADFRTDTSISIGEDEVINDDLYLFGTTITVNGIVNGDVFAAGNSLTVNGTVNGNVFLMGQERDSERYRFPRRAHNSQQCDAIWIDW